MKNLATLREFKHFNPTFIAFVFLFAGIGSYLLVVSHAATPSSYASVNADSGTLSGCATIQSDSMASDGQAVQFGSASGCSGLANTELPVIHGYTTPNSELMVNYGGTWTSSPTSYTYQWQDCNSSGGSCTNATNTTGLSGDPCSPTAFCYVISSAEATAGNKIQVVVTAHNSSTTASAIAAAVGPVSTSEPVNCPLTEAGGLDGQSNYSTGTQGDDNQQSCWGLSTGITGATGCTEAQILAGVSGITNACGSSYFTVISGDQSYSTANKVVANAEITGCVGIQAAATNFHLRDDLLYSQSINCNNNSSNSQNGNLVDGNQTSVPTGVLIEDTTEDARSVNLEANQLYYSGSAGQCPSGNCANNSFGMIIGSGGTVLRLNNFGWAKGVTPNGNTGAVTTIQDSFIHDPPTPASGEDSKDCTSSGGDEYDPHADPFWADSATYVTVEHDWISAAGGGDCVTSPLTFLSDFGAPSHDIVDKTFVDGGSTPGSGRPDAYFGKSGTCASNTTVTNNAFSNDTGGYSPVLEWNPNNTGNTWSGNIVPETGQPLSAPGSSSCS